MESSQSDLQKILAGLLKKPRVFVSYHHERDQAYYDAFSGLFSELYEAVQDESLERMVGSTNSDYVRQRIRDHHIKGTSCTFVLCGADTPLRKYVDWEIKATLDMQHGLVGVNLPSNPVRPGNCAWVPVRFHDDYLSGHALWVQWHELAGGPDYLRALVQQAAGRPASLIDNRRSLKPQNGATNGTLPS